MLMHYGFQETVENLKCPALLKGIMLNCIKTHKRGIPSLQNQGLHPFSSLSNAIPWTDSTDINKFMHSCDSSHNIDFNLNGFGLQLSQGLYRQEAAGKTGLACLMNGEDDLSMVINLSGGKTDQTGVFGYGKRFACNWLEPHNCLVTAIGRNIFSRLSSNSSNYLYMTNEQARRYETKLASKIATNNSKAEPVRVRGLGPHTRFRIHFKRGIMKMDKSRPGRFGMPPHLIAPHCHKRTSYRHLKRCPGVSQDHINARADHRSGNAFVYGAKMVHGNFNSGGPPERFDLTMAKALANLPQRDLIFNQSPPHFTSDFIATIPFDKIVPCFPHLPHTLVKLLPLLLAQLVHHYHQSQGLCSLGFDNPLRLSPLWNDPQMITYRFELFDNLVGASYKSGTTPSVDLRDLDTDNFICQEQSLRNATALLQANAALMRHAGLDASCVDECLGQTRIVLGAVTGRPLEQEPFRMVTGHVCNKTVVSCPRKPSVNESVPSKPSHVQGFRFLEQASGAFVMPVSLQCRFAFFRMHSKGNDKLGLWRGKNAALIDKKIVGKERKRQRELFNKVLAVCKMILGSNSYADVDKIGTDRAWILCCNKVHKIWGFDLLMQGSAAIRSVDNIMHGKDTKFSAQQCRGFVHECETSSWTCVQADQSIVEEAVDLNISADTLNISADLDSVEYLDDRSDDGTGNAHSPRENADNSARDAKDCFVCERCNPIRLFPEWAKYTEHAKKHRPEPKYFFIRSEVRMVRGFKSNNHSKTSSYCALGDPYFKRYSVEETRVHMRQRILYRHILRQNDQIKLYYSEEQPSLFATVLDPQIECIQKAHKVKVLLMGASRIEFQCPVTSILEIVTSSRSTGNVETSPPSTAAKTSATANTKVASPRVLSDASASSKHLTVAKGVAPRALFKSHDSYKPGVIAGLATVPQPVFNASFTQSTAKFAPGPASSFSSSAASAPRALFRYPGTLPAVTAGYATVWQPVCKAHTTLCLGVNILLRGVSECHTWYTTPQVSPPPAPSIGMTGVNLGFPLFKHKGASFIVSDYGMHFSSIYPPWIASALHAFKLDESYRCFYLVLGIALKCDPFMLQCLFRSHAHLLLENLAFIHDQLKGEGVARSYIETELEELNNVKQPGKYFDCCLLRFFWPIQMENIRIVVISVRKGSSFETIFHCANWSQNSLGAQTIYLKLEGDHYTHLTLLRGALTHEASTWLCHEICPEMRCPSINTLAFDTAETKESYIASALSGDLPSGDQVSTIWQRATQEAGLVADPQSGKWVKGIPHGVECSDHRQHGSLKAASWEGVRNSLVSAFLSNQPPKQQRSDRSRVASPIKVSGQDAQQPAGNVPLVFLDVGSEAGTGLLKTLHDSRITHAAGIELQDAWFGLSVRLFKALREEFAKMGYRMPQISLFRSCMMASKPELEYVYAITSIVWMNNCVMDRVPYYINFKSDTGQENNIALAPLSSLKANDPARSSLSSNAACLFSQRCHHSTCFAVIATEYFSNTFHYSHVKRLEVAATWGSRSGRDCTPLSVTILAHKQHVKIARGISLRCVSHHDVCFWHQSLKLWGNSSQQAYDTLKQDKWHTIANGSEGGTIDDNGRICVEDAPDVAQDRFDSLSSARVSHLEAVLSNGWINTLLSLQSAATLQSGHLLDNETVVQYMRLLQTHFPSVSFSSNIIFMHKSLHAMRSRADSKKFATSYMRLQGCSQLIFALNSGIHFQAFKIDTKERFIATMCSMQDTLTHTAKHILDVLASIVPGATQFKHISVHVPSQNNCTDCGPLCCMFMLFLAQNNVTTLTQLQYDTKPTALAMRMRIFADLANDKVTPLEQTGV